MKETINSAVKIDQGSWLLDRQGNLISVKLHAPSTTYTGRGIFHLCPTDAEFLMNQGYITRDEGLIILLYNFVEYMQDEFQSKKFNIAHVTKFDKYAELSYAPVLRSLLMTKLFAGDTDVLVEEYDLYSKFADLNEKWYGFLINNFVKVSRYGKNVEFRISSNDGFDWNKNIIDKVILEHQAELRDCSFAVLKDIGHDQYKAYFLGATLDEVISKDKVVLSSTILKRAVIDKKVWYTQ